MNNMEKIAEMFDIELEEEFTVELFKEDRFKFTTDGLFVYSRTTKAWERSLFMTEILTGEFEIIKLPKQILTDEEKAYLSAVIKPFKNRVRRITKRDLRREGKYEFICIDLVDYGNVLSIITLPYFVKDTLYTGMKLDKAYDLKELEL